MRRAEKEIVSFVRTTRDKGLQQLLTLTTELKNQEPFCLEILRIYQGTLKFTQNTRLQEVTPGKS